MFHYSPKSWFARKMKSAKNYMKTLKNGFFSDMVHVPTPSCWVNGWCSE